PKFFKSVCEALGRAEIAADAYDVEGGGSARVRAELEGIFASKPQAHWVALFRDKDCCVEPVLEGDEVFEDPQLKARGAFVGEQLRTPVHLGALPERAAPALGAHSKQIFE